MSLALPVPAISAIPRFHSAPGLDVVMTATLRPDILDLTLASFQRRFLSQIPNTRLIINIDPVGDAACCVDDVLAVCHRYFSRIVYRAPKQASFPAAVKWGWEKVETEFFLHLEDDWLLKKMVDSDKIFAALEADADLASIRFNLKRNPENSLASNGLSLNPSVMRRAFVQEALPFFSLSLDPEKQYRHMEGLRLAALGRWRYQLYGLPGESAYVVDIGKRWRRLNRLAKWDGDDSTISWKKNHAISAVARIWHAVKYRIFLHYWKLIV